MKKSKIFLSLGALALVIAGAAATKANKKYFTLSNVYYLNGSKHILESTSCSVPLSALITQTSGGTAGNTARFAGYTLYYFAGSSTYLTLFHQ